MSETLKDGSEKRNHESFNYRSAHGRSTVEIKCPFCGTMTRAFVWSLCGGGKKCSNKNCNTLHTGWNISIKRP